MSTMSELHAEIEGLLEQGHTVDTVAVITGAPKSIVISIAADFQQQEEDAAWGPDDLSDDGDALASAGFGTDEDYGHFVDTELDTMFSDDY